MKRNLLALLIASFSFAPFSKSYSQAVNVNDSLALVDLYNSTDGVHWTYNTNWLNTPVNSWYGVSVSNGRVTGINIQYNNLTGILPSSLGNLSKLSTLDLQGNYYISGKIPISLGNLLNLTILDLGSNVLSDTIPSSLGKLIGLTTINFVSNQLTGSIPSSFGKLVNLIDLELSQNHLSGVFPSSLGNLTQLSTFNLSYNQFTGSIPSSLGKLTKLNTLLFNENQLTGPIPSSFQSLINLTGINLSDNQLTGSIAPIGNLPNLQIIQLDNNKLTGTIPTSFSNLQNLALLGLSNNQLTGEVPSLAKTTKLTDIFLQNNQFIGSIPDFRNSRPFGEIHLDHNQFSGSIPEWISTLTTDQITLDNNQLSAIPKVFTNLYQYVIFTIENNHFTFDSLEYIIANSTHQYFTYAPQLNIPITYTPQGAFGKLSVHAGGTLSNNTYQWYKNNVLFKTNIGDSTFVPDAEGVYSVKVNNSVVTNLQLVSDNITIVTACASAPVNTATTSIQSTSAKVSWSASQGAIKYTVQFKPVNATTFSSVTTKTTTATLKNLLPNTQYVWKVRATCSLQNSAFTASNNFTLPPSVASISQADSKAENPNIISIYPNPARDIIRIKGLKFNSESVITILDVQGRKIINAANSKTNEIDVKQLQAGTYFVRIEEADKVTTLKFVKE